MKPLKNLLFLCILLSSNVFAQAPSDKFKSAMKKGLEQFGAARSSADYVQTANYFERIAAAEPTQWYPAYYSAYNNLVAGLMTDDKAAKDQFFDMALKKAEDAEAISKNNSEIYVLKGYIQFMKLSIDPQSRMAFMGQSAASLETAKALNPENPRLYLVRGQDTFYMPEAFGGGKAKAKPFLEIATAKFATFKPANELEPNWGSGQATSLLEKCN